MWFFSLNTEFGHIAILPFFLHIPLHGLWKNFCLAMINEERKEVEDIGRVPNPMNQRQPFRAFCQQSWEFCCDKQDMGTQKCSMLKPQQKYYQAPPPPPPARKVLTTEWLVQALLNVQAEPTWEPQSRQGCCEGKHYTGKLPDPGLY